MSYITKKVEINGVLDTGNFCLDNLQSIADSSQAFISWDPIDGKWVANINRKDTTNPNGLDRIFSDANILGAINVTGLGINSLYNVATATYYDERLKGTKDEVRVFIPDQDRLEYEVENSLTLNYDLVNDPGQAAYAASVELKTSRLQYTIEFTTDYTEIGIRAGEIIGLRSELYFTGSETTPKKFRVISVEEVDTGDGGIALSITAVEYDDAVYDITGFSIEERNKNTSIIPKEINVEIGREEDVSIGKQIGGLFAAGVINGVIDSIFNVDPVTGAISQTITPQNDLETLLDDYASGVLNDLITDYDDGTLNVAAAISVEEEGTEITATVDSFNFVGGAILAEATGNAVTVTCNATPDPDGTLADVISDYEAGLLGGSGGNGGGNGGGTTVNSCDVYFSTGFINLAVNPTADPDISEASTSCTPIFLHDSNNLETISLSTPSLFVSEPGNYTLEIKADLDVLLYFQAFSLSRDSITYKTPSLPQTRKIPASDTRFPGGEDSGQPIDINYSLGETVFIDSNLLSTLNELVLIGTITDDIISDTIDKLAINGAIYDYNGETEQRPLYNQIPDSSGRVQPPWLPLGSWYELTTHPTTGNFAIRQVVDFTSYYYEYEADIGITVIQQSAIWINEADNKIWINVEPSGSNSSVYEIDNPNFVDTASYSGRSANNLGFFAWADWDNDGSILYIRDQFDEVRGANDDVEVWYLTTPYDITSVGTTYEFLYNVDTQTHAITKSVTFLDLNTATDDITSATSLNIVQYNFGTFDQPSKFFAYAGPTYNQSFVFSGDQDEINWYLQRGDTIRAEIMFGSGSDWQNNDWNLIYELTNLDDNVTTTYNITYRYVSNLDNPSQI